MLTFMYFFWSGWSETIAVVNADRCEYTIPGQRMEFTIPAQRMECTVNR